ncbi:MAG: hypothetical protein WCA36_05195 [Pseudolabrys sp.]|jgi:multimeric flavodoxin WrbA
MKSMLPIMAALMLVTVSVPAIAQSQEDQQACEGDVYDLCGDKIPDQDAIVVCLRKHWSKVSKECRHVMVSYGKNRHKKKRHNGHKSATELNPNVTN